MYLQQKREINKKKIFLFTRFRAINIDKIPRLSSNVKKKKKPKTYIQYIYTDYSILKLYLLFITFCFKKEM